jgi:polysaccharide export outer membrane protein
METNNKIKIFLVDDDLFCLNLYLQGIKNLGYTNVSSFNNGIGCINNLDQNPDVVFLDHNMDNLNGFEVLKKIKSFNPNIYIVMVSAQADIKTAVNSFKYGVFDYIVKGDNELKKIENVLLRITEIQNILIKRLPE